MADRPAGNLDSYQRQRRAVITGLALLILLVLLFGRSALPESLHEDLELFGVALVVAGIGGRLWSILYIGGRKSREVVETGPYSVTRNPLYLFSTVAAAGFGAQMGSVVATVGFALACAAAFHVVIRREEAFLRAQLGEPFESYCARVPRFWPRPSLYRDEREVTFKPRLLLNTLRDGLIFFASLPFFETVEWAQEHGFLPVLFQLW